MDFLNGSFPIKVLFIQKVLFYRRPSSINFLLLEKIFFRRRPPSKDDLFLLKVFLFRRPPCWKVFQIIFQQTTIFNRISSSLGGLLLKELFFNRRTRAILKQVFFYRKSPYMEDVFLQRTSFYRRFSSKKCIFLQKVFFYESPRKL